MAVIGAGLPCFLPVPWKPTVHPVYYASLFGFLSLVENLITKASRGHKRHWQSLRDSAPRSRGRGICRVCIIVTETSPSRHQEPEGTPTPLFSAAQSGQTEIGQHLLNHGADVNAREEDGSTPFHLAALFGELKFIYYWITVQIHMHAIA
jgi:hypothetical protein